MTCKLLVVTLFIFCCSGIGYTQVVQRDSTVLPFAIAEEKKLSPEDLADKKEGYFITGYPDLSSDPLNGFGYGIEGSLLFNGKKSDPFFAYTPYRSRLDVTVFNTSRNQREFFIKYDAPFIFDTKWRLRIEAGYERNPNKLYFGKNENSLQKLSYFPGGDSSKTLFSNATYSDYEANLSAGAEKYNWFDKEEFIFNISAEHSYYDGRVRLLAGYELAHFNIRPINGRCLLQEEAAKGETVGFGKGLVAIAQIGAVYDTRDLESDPSKGVFAEITNELSLQAIGSKYNFNKLFIHGKIYVPVLPSIFRKWVFAGRIGLGQTSGNAPFFEYQDQWSSEGSMEGLGGAVTLRGYKQSRFLARSMTFANLELRCRLFQVKTLKQTFAFNAVPFYDIGVVANEIGRLSQTSNYRQSVGAGMRIAWNLTTILRFDYAVSQEDKQFFFALSHPF